MRKGLVAGLIGVGAFLVVFSILALAYMPGQLMKTPLDVDSTTRLVGTATLNGETVPIKATSITKVDSEKSDDDVVVFVSSTCVVKDEGDVPDCVSADDPEERLVSASEDSFATDRNDAMAVNDTDYVPADAGPHEGLVNKFPFETEKKTYPYWVGTIGETTDAVYTETVDIDGLETYRFDIEVEPTEIEIADGVPGLFSTTKELYVDPVTGSIIRQKEVQTRTTEDGDPVAEINLDFTDEQVDANREDAEANISKLNLVTNTIPLIGLIVGIPMLLAGLVLAFLARHSSGGTRSAKDDD